MVAFKGSQGQNICAQPPETVKALLIYGPNAGLVRERAKAAQAEGYKAQKWFFRHGPMSGPEGLAHNVELVKTLRETLGEGDSIMLDCWQSMDVPYVLELAQRIYEYRPYWLEECVMPDRIDSYRRIKDKINIPLSGAEHEYTRWGFKRFVDAGALDILQPDIYWCGGLSVASRRVDLLIILIALSSSFSSASVRRRRRRRVVLRLPVSVSQTRQGNCSHA